MKIDPKDYKDLKEGTKVTFNYFFCEGQNSGKIRTEGLDGTGLSIIIEWNKDGLKREEILYQDSHIRHFQNAAITDLETIEYETSTNFVQFKDKNGKFPSNSLEGSTITTTASTASTNDTAIYNGDNVPQGAVITQLDATTKPRTIRDVEVGDIIYNTANHSKWVVDKIMTDGIEASYVNSNSSDLSYELLESTYSLSDTITIFEKKYTADEVREKLKDLKEAE